MKKLATYLPAEWEAQSAVQLTWPDSYTDWTQIMDEIVPVYEQVAREITAREKLLIVCRDKNTLPTFLLENAKVQIHEMPINDTWARDHGAITIIEKDKPVLLNFRFNGWGMKFAANHDNQITPTLMRQNAFAESIMVRDFSYFTLEGGAIESNGKGCILTTSKCLLSKNRNEHMSKQEIEFLLKKTLHAGKVLWLDNGSLEGDDTDSHIDTLARFCNEDTIAYVKCDDPNDIHFEAFQKMEQELQKLTDQNGKPFNLVPLPFPEAVYDEDRQRLPATYANFLILNKAVLLPVYEVIQDGKAIAVMKELFPEREIIPVNARSLISQHGSIHCISMQFPEGVF